MNNIELEQLKRDVKKYLNYSDERTETVGLLPDSKMNAVKNAIEEIKFSISKQPKSNKEAYEKNRIKRKIDEIFKQQPELKKAKILGSGVGKSRKQPVGANIGVPKKKFYHTEKEVKRIQIDPNRKPKIIFLSDVKGWAWWIKSEYLRKHLSDEFKIKVECLLGTGCVPANRIDQNNYDLYFTFGYSYIDFLSRVPKFRKITGITAHRTKSQIFPKMKMAGHVHANSKLLLK